MRLDGSSRSRLANRNRMIRGRQVASVTSKLFASPHFVLSSERSKDTRNTARTDISLADRDWDGREEYIAWYDGFHDGSG